MGDLEDILAALAKTDVTPTIPLTDIEPTRFSDLAAGLERARINGYIESNDLTQLLELAKMLIPLIPVPGV
jgi:hypothetical protein